MSWFWGGQDKKDDPTKSLDPKLKKFLDEQEPRPYVRADEKYVAPEPEQKPAVSLPDTNKTFEDRPLPKESLYPDGRYKDIWKTYTPQNEIIAATTSTLDRVVTHKKDRAQVLHRAALENCAFEQEVKDTCFDTGDLANRVRARFTMCSKEHKAFNRCYQLQSKFLQALGYMSSSTTTAEDEERIQMHADKLYHRMMDYEAAVDEARLNKQPIPPLSSVFNPAKPVPTIEQFDLPPGFERKFKKPLHEMQPHERELAVRAALSSAKMIHLYAKEFETYAMDMDKQRKARQQWLVKIFGEPIGQFLIPDPPKPVKMEPYKIEDLENKIWQDGDNAPQTTVPPDLKRSHRNTG